MMIPLALVVVLGWVSLAGATTYYVGTSGNDSNAGTIGSRWRNPQKCAQPPVTAGDTCFVGDGTYTAAEAGSTAFVIQISTAKGSATGTALNPITIKSENWNGAKLVQPTRNAQAVAIYVSKEYYVIEGFEIDGSGVTYDNGTNASHAGIGAYTSNVIIRQNYIHDIARTQCSDSSFGNAGLFTNPGASNILIEKNRIHTIGRLRNGESGCVTARFQHDHGIYITWGSDITVRNNLVYDTNRGYPMNIYSASNSVHTRYKIYNNTFAGRSPTGAPSGHIIIGGTWVNGEIRNNLFFQPDPDLIIQQFNLNFAVTSSGNTISHNRTNLDIPGADFLFGTTTPTGFTSSSNTENTALGFAGAACSQSDGGCEATDFTLGSGSAAIGAGTNVGILCNAGCDQGAFQTFNFASCQVPNSAANTIQMTFTSNVNLLGSTFTGFTARRNGSNNALTGAASKIGDTIVSLPLTTTYVGGDTPDVSCSSACLTDNALIGGTLNQPFIQALSSQTCANNAGGAPAYVFTQARYQFRGLHGPETTTDKRGVDNVSVYEVQKGGAARVRVVLTCTVADCPGTAFFLRYSKDGGPYTIVPDAYGADNIGFCSTHVTAIGVTNAEPTTAQIPEIGGTFVAGGVILTSTAIPTVLGFNAGFKTEMEYCVSFDTDASGDYLFRLYQQNGTALTYTQTPQISIVNPSAPAGF